MKEGILMTKFDLLKDALLEELLHKLTELQSDDVNNVIEWYFRELKKVANMKD